MADAAQFPECELEGRILSLLEHQTYEQVSRSLGISRGKIWATALKHRARKNEARIQERARDREERQREFLREILDTTIKSDVLDFLDSIPDASVNMHVTSVPYNVGVTYGSAARIDRQRYHFYLGWLLQVCSEMQRTLAPGGVLFLQLGSTRDDEGELEPLDTLLFGYLKSMGLKFVSRVVWEVPHGLVPKGRLAERFETALVFACGTPRTFNPTPLRTPHANPSKRAFKGPNRGAISSHPLGSFPGNVWRISNVKANHPEKGAGSGHPAQFPEEIARRAVLGWSVPGDVVVDAFVGSGTTAVVCKKEGRHFIGADLFYETGRDARLANTEASTVSRLPGVTDQTAAIWHAEARRVEHPAKLAA